MKLMRTLACVGVAALALGVFTQPAHATNTATGTLTVTASVVAACTVSNATLAFGSYIQSSSGAIDQSANITVTCATPFVMAMSYGANGGSASNRVMASTATPADTLNYNLYTTNTYTAANVWQDTSTCGTIGSGGTNCVNETGGSSPYTIPVYGQIPSGQSSPIASDYTDTVTMTVTY